jgi:hypothetical protein
MTKYYHYLRHPKTANEKRANASFKADKNGHKIKGRVRTKGTSSRLTDVYDDIASGAVTNKHRDKQNYSAARKAKEIEKGRQLAA